MFMIAFVNCSGIFMSCRVCLIAQKGTLLYAFFRSRKRIHSGFCSFLATAITDKSAIRKAKQSILEQKKQADMYVYFTHRWNRLQQEHPEDFEAEHIADEVQRPEIEEEALYLGDGIDARNWVSFAHS
jgi:hypothetical protein